MKVLGKNVRGLGKKPFAAFALLGLLGFGLDLAVNPGVGAEQNLTARIDARFLATAAQAAGNAASEIDRSAGSSQTTEAQARLLFKENESTLLRHGFWGLEKFGRFVD